MAPGGLASVMTEIYQEGLRIPPIKLFRRGELQTDIFDLLLLNVRLPEERRGDYFAQISACRLGERRFKELAASTPRETMFAAFDEIIERTARRMREGFRRLKPGTYRIADVLDGDGHGNVDIPIKLAIEVGDGTVRLDFRGSARQVVGNINMTFNATQSAVCYALKALLDEDVPNNQGVLDAIEIVCDEGSLLNCAFPAAVAQRTSACQRIADMIVGALKDAVPDLACGASNGSNTAAIFTGIDPRTGQRYLYLETLGGGFGGRAGKDGKDGVQVHITNPSTLPIEAIESEYPLLVESYEPAAGAAARDCAASSARSATRPASPASWSGSAPAPGASSAAAKARRAASCCAPTAATSRRSRASPSMSASAPTVASSSRRRGPAATARRPSATRRSWPRMQAAACSRPTTWRGTIAIGGPTPPNDAPGQESLVNSRRCCGVLLDFTL